METKNNISFKSTFYNMTTKVQENTLLNRGLMDIGGMAIPQALMSNNKDEAIERGTTSGLYFLACFCTPFILMPMFNRHALKSNKIVQDLKSNEKRILEVSKEYLTKDGEHLVSGMKKFADELFKEKNIDIRPDFDNIIKRFPDAESLRKTLLKAHESVLKNDILTTMTMWFAIPWGVTEFTERRTNKKGYSGSFKLIDREIDEKKYRNDKIKKAIISVLYVAALTPILSKVLMKGVGGNHSALLNSKNILSKGTGNVLNLIKKHADKFDYTEAIFMSKTLFALMWLTGDYPHRLIQARDFNERKDRGIREAAVIAIFFGGDLMLNNICGRLSDKFLGTKIMDTHKLDKNAGFFKKLLLQPHKFKNLGKAPGLTAQSIQRTKNIGVGLYWLCLLTNMAILGISLPMLMNWILRQDIEKEKKLSAKNNQNQNNIKLPPWQTNQGVFSKFNFKHKST